MNDKMAVPRDGWAGPDGELARYIAKESRRTLNSYREQPNLIAEHAAVEQDTAHGGYQHRQLFELVQNSADALWVNSSGQATESYGPTRPGGRVEVRLTKNYLYCADDGEPIRPDGIRALMFSHLSPKRGTSQIGTFGLGFKAVLGVSDSPEFLSRSGSFRFDRARSHEQLRAIEPDAGSYPVLRLPESIDPAEYSQQDALLGELMEWAVNIVRLPLLRGARKDLRKQMKAFSAEFLLFVAHVQRLALTDDAGKVNRLLELAGHEDAYVLSDGVAASQWRLFEGTHLLSSDARADRRPGDDRNEVPVSWAAPLDRLDRPGKFWAFFPTNTASLVPGILNAPWKTNEDRQNLLAGRYNDELIEAASELIAEALPGLSTDDDPARHLDALPRRHEAGDSEQADLLRECLFTALDGRPIVPDQDGKLRRVKKLSYPPRQLTQDRAMETAALERWAASPTRPRRWLHNKAVTRARLAAIDRLFEVSLGSRWNNPGVPRASIAQWLEALVEDAPAGGQAAASAAAVQVAALISPESRPGVDLGEILLTAAGTWQSPDPEHIFVPDEAPMIGSVMDPASCVHPALVSDDETRAALKTLGLKPPSPESRFRLAAEGVLDPRHGSPDPTMHERLWLLTRKLKIAEVLGVIGEHNSWPRRLRVKTRSGTWKLTHSVLIPGKIVPGDGSRDDDATVDMAFHQSDLELLTELGIGDAPVEGRDLASEPIFREFQNRCEQQYRRRDDLPHWPRREYLDFDSTEGVGPVTALGVLSDEGAALFTDALLQLDASYEPWTMWHTGTNGYLYPEVSFNSLTVDAIRTQGRIRIADGIVPFADALGPQPASPQALHVLLRHPKADQIKEVFELSEPVPEFFGEGEPIPLTDVWPGLVEHLPVHRRTSQLILCEHIHLAGEERDCVFQSPDVYLAGNVEDDERASLELITGVLDLDLTRREIEAILLRNTPAEIEERRAAVRQHATDAERLLAAIGEEELRLGLPQLLLDALGDGSGALRRTDVAEAAIATYHTDALRQFKWALDALDPPATWAGSRRAIEFVRSLGFSEEWAGERNRRRPPFMEVEGPWSLPKLHDYQQTIAANVRKMLQSEQGESTERRGMLSMPTGSGKTRVAVQAIVEAMRDDGFRGGVLWVADRDELCEQAVVAWSQVWRSLGAEAMQLRISRMWSGQPRPLPTSERHVVVATVQTLSARLSNRPAEFEFLKDFTLAVFDEAHRSIAPTFTSVMQEIGLTYRRREDEPFLLGLTATPYRGRDEEETARLVRRYGQNRLDAGAFTSDDPRDVITELQGMGVLARADQEVIEGGTFHLTPEELEEVSRFARGTERLKYLLAWLPQSVEDRVAQDSQRTARIIEAYQAHVKPDWPTLIFATSVEHAQTLAALLNLQGITARSVSGMTEPAVRRRVVDGFRRGEITALVNYGVFREGFDAPKTRAIIVARPVYSPNLYFQMIGRGLRGPLNGGDDRCLILNVRDTIDNFGQGLAFADLDWLWDR
ncbi:MAG: DEAD/DEAH box helicase [Acidimicrobiaceae bacterium]|nr:DEAD/DEAH box helicase [Acidimicrobiaceae bacterium]